MKKYIFLTCLAYLLMFIAVQLPGQVSINMDGSNPDNSAMLDVKSTTKGVLPPRMTRAQIERIPDPANGLQVFCTTDSKLYIFVAFVNQWKEVAFGTGAPLSCGNLTDSRDSKVYSTVQIGTQCWMAQNLNIGTRIDGSVDQTDNSVIEKHCYANLESNCDVYGGLYQWAELVQYLNGATNTTSWDPVPTGNVQGICPPGWHLPTFYDEWTVLTNFLGGDGVAGGMMKETSTTHWTSPNWGATNSSGFTALGGGYRESQFSGLNEQAHFWSASETDSFSAWGNWLDYSWEFVFPNPGAKTYGYSVRCLRD